MFTTRPAHPTARAPGSPSVHLLDAMPELRRAIPAGHRATAAGALLAPVESVADGVFSPLAVAPATGHPAFAIVLDGIVLRKTSLQTRTVTEVVGEGDIIDTRDDIEPSLLPSTTSYVAHRPVTLAFLDDRFRAAARRWPAVYDVVHEQLARQQRRASAHLAILQLARVEDRIAAVFSHLADRWGRVTPHGIVIDLPLTHELIGQIIGGRRPTVSLALGELASSGALVRRRDGSWLLAPAAVTAAAA